MSMNISDFARLGQVFHGSSQASGLCTGLSSTATGLIVNNPFGSGTNFLLFDACAAGSAAPATFGEIAIAASASISPTAHTATTPGTLRAAKQDGTSGRSVAQVFTVSTTPVLPVIVKVIPGGVTTAAVQTPTWFSKIDGSIILVPGTFAQFVFITTAVNAVWSMSWAEVPAF